MRGCVGRDHDAGARRLSADEPESGECTAAGEEAAPRSQNQRVDQEHVLVDEVARISDWTSSPLPRTTRSLPPSSLSLATASAASPLRSVELLHGSGSESVVDATYFWVLFSTSVKGLSVRLGQTV